MCCRSQRVKESYPQVKECRYTNGDHYNGGFGGNKLRTGHGVYKFTNGAVYDGMWHEDKRHGRGTYTFPNGDVYIGQFVKGRSTGRGIRTSADGSKYEGMWLDDLRHGEGTMEYPDGKTYKGEWVEDQRSGLGVATYRGRQWAKYDGMWHKDQWQGHGTCVYVSGDRYEGEWVRSVCSGVGTFTRRDGSKYTGQWWAGKQHGEGTWEQPSLGIVYVGNWVGGLRSGHGTCLYGDGRTYDGQWREGREDGPGKMHNPDGSTEDCFFVLGVRLEDRPPTNADEAQGGDSNPSLTEAYIAALQRNQCTAADPSAPAAGAGAATVSECGSGTGNNCSPKQSTMSIPQCEICFTTYNTTDKKPCLCVGCGNTLCAGCILQVRACPFCRREVGRNESGAFVTNVTLLQMVHEWEQ